MAHGIVTIRTLDGRTRIDCPMGEAPAILTGGDGGWELEERPGLPPVTVWKAPQVIRQVIPILFDGGEHHLSIESAGAVLNALTRPPAERESPPLLRISGPAVHSVSRVWVAESLVQEDTVIRRAGDGDRTRQAWTLTLIEHSDVSVLVRRSPSKKARAKARRRKRGGTLVGTVGKPRPGIGRTHTLRTGETLAIIAARVYGDARKWKAIAAANNIKDPNHPGKPGRVLRLP